LSFGPDLRARRTERPENEYEAGTGDIGRRTDGILFVPRNPRDALAGVLVDDVVCVVDPHTGLPHGHHPDAFL
jgi:hypothetical protein